MLLSKSLLTLSLIIFRSSYLFYLPLIILLQPLIKIYFNYSYVSDPLILYVCHTIHMYYTFYVYCQMKLNRYIQNTNIGNCIIKFSDKYYELDRFCDQYVKTQIFSLFYGLIFQIMKNPKTKEIFGINDKRSVLKIMKVNLDFIKYIKDLINENKIMILIDEDDFNQRMKLTETQISKLLNKLR